MRYVFSIFYLEQVQKQGKVYLSSKHKRRGYLGGVSRYQNRVLSKSLSLCTCNNPFYSAYKSLIHRVNFGQTIHAACCQGNVVVFGENAETTMCCNEFVRFNLQ